MTEPGEYTLAAAAKGYAPDSHQVTVASESQKADLQLCEGGWIRLRVVGKDGKPMPAISVSTVFDSPFRNALMLDYESAIERDNDRHMLTDANGRWERLWLLHDPLHLIISKPGYVRVDKKLAAGDPECVVTLAAGGWNVVGQVVDSETSAPVTEFHVVEGDNYSSHPIWRNTSIVKNVHGNYDKHWDDSENGHRIVRIEANGYLPSEARQIDPKEQVATFNVKLRKSKEIAGRVLGPDGKPAADAEVCLCSATRLLLLRDGRAAVDQNPLIARTTADGRFTQTPQGEPYVLVVLHEKGYARFDGNGESGNNSWSQWLSWGQGRSEDDKGPGDITLKPWGRVEGTLRIADQPAAKQRVRLVFDDEVISNPKLMDRGTISVDRYLYYQYEADTDDNGHFSIERVRPGKAKLCQYIRLSKDGDDVELDERGAEGHRDRARPNGYRRDWRHQSVGRSRAASQRGEATGASEAAGRGKEAGRCWSGGAYPGGTQSIEG